MPAELVNFVAPVDVVVFFGVPLILMVCIFVQEWRKFGNHRRLGSGRSE